ncbi:MAG: alpha/beta fold hydrolase, partial [Polyangiaceae bacterium]
GLGAVVLGFAAVGALYTPDTTIPQGAAGALVTVRDVPLRVAQSGKGRDVLLIHGSPGSIEDWGQVVTALSASYHVTVFDRPGQGYSGDPGQYSFAYNADTALALIEALHLDHVLVVGHSYGGSTALAMAEKGSPRTDAFVVIDSASYVPQRKVDAPYRLASLPLFGVGFSSVVGPLVAPGKIRRGLNEAFAGHEVPEEFAAARVRLWSTPKVAHATAVETVGAADGLAAQSGGYPRITKPVVVVYEADNEFRRTTAEHLHRDIPGSSMHLVPDTGHMIPLEKPAEVVAAVHEADRMSASPATGAPAADAPKSMAN